MHLYRGLHNLPALTSRSVVTIGNFDGVHRGHQAIFEQARSQARASGCNSIVLMFEPQPLEFFKPELAPVRLTRLREKLILIRQFDIDNVVCLTFNSRLAAMSAEDFVSDILVQRLRARAVIVGEDFRYGHRRQAGVDELVESGRKQGFEVQLAGTLVMDGQRISSSNVRDALKRADLETAEKLLGRRYSLSGRVIHGDRRGRELGFATANVSLERTNAPLKGVFATTVLMGDEHTPLPAVTNIGHRPVFGGGPLLMETHLLDFNADVYGRLITVVIHKHLRDEQKFDSIADLKTQVARDIEAAREYFGSDGTG